MESPECHASPLGTVSFLDPWYSNRQHATLLADATIVGQVYGSRPLQTRRLSRQQLPRRKQLLGLGASPITNYRLEQSTPDKPLL